MKNYCVPNTYNYKSDMYFQPGRYLFSKTKREPLQMILSFLILSQKIDYYKIYEKKGRLIDKILYLVYLSRKNQII